MTQNLNPIKKKINKLVWWIKFKHYVLEINCFTFQLFYFEKKNVFHKNYLKIQHLSHVYVLYTQSVVIGILDNRIREGILIIQNYKWMHDNIYCNTADSDTIE